MLSKISKLIFISFFVMLFWGFSAKDAYALGPVVTGRVVISGSGAPVAGVWVRWDEDFATSFQSAHRYVQTDANGIYTFLYWPDFPPGQRNVAEKNSIDINFDGAGDDVEVFIDPKKPIPGVAAPSDAQHFDSVNNPHAFTAVVPAGWNGAFSNVTGVALNNLASVITNPDIVFTPSTATPTPAATNIYKITGNVYTDTNKNGILEGGETGFAGVKVTMTGAKSATTTTDANGNYAFTSLNPGDYTLTVTEPSGYRVTSALTSNVTLSADAVVNFGIIKKTGLGSGCTAAIAGTVFNDTSKDGIINVTEGKLANWTVTLSSIDLPVPLSMQTDSNGAYSFGSLCSGNYTVKHTVPAPWVATTQVSYTLSVLDGNNYSNNNFGVNKIFDVSGTVFIDSNNNQLKEGNEPTFAGVTILASGPAFASGTTDVNGQYLFKDLPAGDYVVTVFQPPGSKSTTPNYYNLTLVNDKVINFGFNALTATGAGGKCTTNAVDFVIAIDHSSSMHGTDPASGLPKIDAAKNAAIGFVDLIAQHVAGSQVGLVQFSTSSNFPNNPTASGIASPLTTNYTQVKNAINAIPDSDGTCIDCAVNLANKMLQQQARPNAQKIVIILTDGRANHSYLSGDPENNAILEVIDGVDKQNIIYDTIGVGKPVNDINEPFLKQIASANGGYYYNDPADGQLLGIFNTIANNFVGHAKLAGNIFNDLDDNKVRNGAEGPLANWVVTLTGGTLSSPLVTQSDAAGNYAFNVLCDGTYTAKETIKQDWVPTTSSSVAINSVNGGSYLNINFGNIFGYRISGNVFYDYIHFGTFDAFENRHPGAFNIIASRGNVTTKPDGTYVITGLLPGPVNVSYTSLPSGYFMTSPLNGPPPTFQVIVGPSCNTLSAPGASCQ